ncbi:MAG: flagellar basal body rod protein FlgB [Chthonomonas sp.]|nr:flagellar basal body rod protein FlgB [Chthonomonas sp.]
MQYLDAMFGSHAVNLERALDKASLRQGLLTRNISNVNTPGYKRRDVDMNISLEQDNSGRFESMLNDRRQRETEQTSIRIDGNNVDMERETFAIAETEIRYQLLTDLTNRYFSGLKNVIREGR